MATYGGRHPLELGHLPASIWGRGWHHYRRTEAGDAEFKGWLKALAKKVVTNA